MNLLPEETLRYVLQKLPGKEIHKCRRVRKLWKEIIDTTITTTDEFWRGCCAAEYSEIYLEAKSKALPSLTWREMYKSLSLWSSLGSANERWEKICTQKKWYSTDPDDRVLNVKNGLVTIQNDDSIECMDFNINKVTRFLPSDSKIIKYHENDLFILILHSFFPNGLKILPKKGYEVTMRTVFMIDYVQDFICVNNTIYFVIENMGVYRYDLHPSLEVADQNSYRPQYINENDQKLLFEIDDVILMSFKDNKVIAIDNGGLENDRAMIFYDVKTGAVTRENLPNGEDIFQKLLEYDCPKYMRKINWYRLHQAMSTYLCDTKKKLKQHIQTDEFNFIITAVKMYGDIIFIGSSVGHVLVFHNPYNNGKIDFNIKPVKIYEIFQLSHLSDKCIFHIDVMESKTGPILFVSYDKDIFLATLGYACEE